MADWFSAGVLLARQQRFRSGENAIFPIFSKWPIAFCANAWDGSPMGGPVRREAIALTARSVSNSR